MNSTVTDYQCGYNVNLKEYSKNVMKNKIKKPPDTGNIKRFTNASN